MLPVSPALPPWLILDGPDVAVEVLQAIGYRSTLKTATIVSYNMQDYDFWGGGTLSHLLLRQLSLGASIQLMTTPPPGKATQLTFQRKYALLSALDKNGVQVFVNDRLHAKAYLFVDNSDVSTAIVGSINLTEKGFGKPSVPTENLVEMAIVSSDPAVLESAEIFVQTKIVADHDTESFATWFTRHSVEIGNAGI